MKYTLTLIAFALFCISFIYAQNVGIGTTAPKTTAQLDVTSTTKGVLLPRLTTAQRKAIANPERGLLLFDTDKGAFMFFDGINWKLMTLTDEDVASLSGRNSSTPAAGAHFGQNADISGNYAVIGAPFYASPTVGAKMGEAYIFVKDPTGWKMQTRLAAPDSSSFDYFGSAVAIYDDYCVIGCSQKMVNGNINQGKIYIYKRNGATWNLESTQTEPNGIPYVLFGYSVDVTMNSANLPMIAVGSPSSNNGRGRVYTYTRNAATNAWSYLQTLGPADLTTIDAFGSSVSIDKDYLAAGAPQQNNVAYYNTPDAGAVYIFVFGGGVFTQQQKLQGYYPNAEFGYTLSLYGDKLAVAAPWQPASGFSTGFGYVTVVKRTGANWDYTFSNFGTGEPDRGNFNTLFGLKLSLTENQLLIGAPADVITQSGGATIRSLPGSAYLFTTTNGGTTYYLKQKITPPVSYVDDAFGHAVAIEPGGNYIIGIPYQNVTTVALGLLPEAGGVYFGYYGQ